MMAVRRVDETLGKALASDSTPIPRFDIINGAGVTVAQDAKLVLKNPITQAGMPANKLVFDELLAASGPTQGTATAYTLAQPGFTLFDGAPVLLKLHAATGVNPTLNIQGTGAKSLVTSTGEAFKSKLTSGWFKFYYSTTLNKYVFSSGMSTQVGQLVTSISNNLGSDYLLANGALYDGDAYPELAAIDPKLGSFAVSTIGTNTNTANNWTSNMIQYGSTYVFASLGTAGMFVHTAPAILGPWTSTIVSANTTMFPAKVRVANNIVFICCLYSGAEQTLLYYSTNLTTWTLSGTIANTGASGTTGMDIMYASGTYYVTVVRSGVSPYFHYSASLAASGWATSGYPGSASPSSSRVTDAMIQNGYFAYGVNDPAGTVRVVWGTSAATTSYNLVAATGLAYHFYYFGTNFFIPVVSSTSSTSMRLCYANNPSATFTIILLTTTDGATVSQYSSMVYDGTYYYVFANGALASTSVICVWRATVPTGPWSYLGTIGFPTSLYANMDDLVYLGAKFVAPDVGTTPRLAYSSTPTGSFKKLPTQTVTDAYVYIKVQ